MKKIDQYIVGKLLSTFLFFILGFIVIAIVIDTAENIDLLLASNATLSEIITQYFLPLCVHFGNLLSPFLVFLAVIWVTSQMAQQSEIVAILSGGISFKRLLAPFLATCLFITFIVLIASHFLVPATNKVKYDFSRDFLKKRTYFDHHSHRELSPGKHYYFRTIDESTQVGRDLSIEDWENGQMKQRFMADKAVFDTTQSVWTLSNVVVRKFLPSGKEEVSHIKKMDTTLTIRFSDFGQRNDAVWNLKTSELITYLKREKEKGSGKAKHIEIEIHTRTANAFSILVLGFIAVSIASRKTRGGLGVHLLAAIIIGLVFLFTSRISSVSVTNAGIPAAIATWVPNVAFTIIGLFIYRRAPK